MFKTDVRGVKVYHKSYPTPQSCRINGEIVVGREIGNNNGPYLPHWQALGNGQEAGDGGRTC